MQNNEVKIKGRVYKYTLFHTKNDKVITTFGLQFYNGKDEQGKSKYCFVDCKAFKDYQLSEKQYVVVFGHLAVEEWTDKTGNKRQKVCILIDNIEYKQEKKEDNFIEDEVPWN